MNKEEVQVRLTENIQKFKPLAQIYDGVEAWVVESKNHVNVGGQNGLNGTAFAVKSSTACVKAVVFHSIEEAERDGVEYYLVDGKNHPIYTFPVRADEFF